MKATKRFLRYFTVCLASVLMIVAILPYSNAFFWDKGVLKNDPSISTFAKNSDIAAEVKFSKEDFTSRLSSGAVLKGIVLYDLPDSSLGHLKLGSKSLMTGEAISTNSLNELKFIPVSAGELKATFKFIPVFSEGLVDTTPVKVNINMAGKRNTPPVVETLFFETYTNISVSGAFDGFDPEGEKVTYSIVDKPALGEVKAENNKFVYVPHQNKTGTDVFTYIAVDESGNSSDPGIIKIDIKKRNDKGAVTYNDMQGKPGHYEAIKLSEAGILTGEKIGSSYFLNPDKAVTRGEFVAMAVTCAGLSLPAAAVNTGLSDDDKIPVWAKPYVSAALKAGIISGSQNYSGETVFRASDPITRGEAAVIINNLTSIKDESREVFYSDEKNIPAWAMQAVLNLESQKIMMPYDDGSLRLSDKVNRIDAVQLLYNTVKAINKKENIKSGIFFWNK